MKKETKNNSILKRPQYPGGNQALGDFITQNLQYPKEAHDAGVEGIVHLRYDINHLGNVVGAQIIKKLGYGCDEEAIRLVKLLKFKVSVPRGMKIIWHKKIQIQFKIQATQSTPVSGTTTIAYHYVTTPPLTKQSPTSNKTSYSITLAKKTK
jgi:protein TonB